MTTALAHRRSARVVRHLATAADARRRPASGARAAGRSRQAASREVGSVVIVIGLIAALFVVAVLYLGQTTAVSSGGYQAQRLIEQRDELRRQNSLLEVRITALDSPPRIETAAKSIGLVRARTVPILPAEALAASR